MRSLRHLTLAARLVLATWLLSLGVAIASPLVQPRGLEMVCAGGVMKLVAPSDDGDAPPATAQGDCPLCASHGGLPPAPAVAGVVHPPQQETLPLPAEPRPTLAALAPLPARGPPVARA